MHSYYGIIVSDADEGEMVSWKGAGAVGGHERRPAGPSRLPHPDRIRQVGRSMTRPLESPMSHGTIPALGLAIFLLPALATAQDSSADYTEPYQELALEIQRTRQGYNKMISLLKSMKDR